MRFLLFDRVLALEKGRSILGLAAFGRSSVLAGSDRQSPFVPASMLIEAMVQLLGWAVIHNNDFRLAAIVCLVEGATLHEPALAPGTTAEIGGEILAGGKEDSLGRAWIDAGGIRRATIERVIYRHFHDVDSAALEREFLMRAGRFGGGPIADREKRLVKSEV
jgi:hypothetical protein